MTMWSGTGLLLRVFAAALIVATSTAAVFAQVTSNVFRRTFLIKYGDEFGTAFTLDVDGRQYLITAKHVVAGMKDADTIHVRKGDDWVPLKANVLRCADPIDIAVLIPPEQISVSFQLEPDMSSVQYGQEVYFVGYPYGLFTEGKNVNGPFPLAFIKRAAMSATNKVGDGVVIYLDGHNNPGFSGGPVVFRDFAQNGYVMKVLGVVSGFPAEYTPIFEKKEVKPNEITPEDLQKGRIILESSKVFRLHETSHVVPLNTGIVKAFSIQHAVDLIKAHPAGPTVSATFAEWPAQK
jgi:hypothetical protein